jgi:type I restriction enzyme S subunit
LKKYQYRLGELIERVIDNRGKTPPYQNEGIPIIEVASIAKNNRHPDYKKVNKYVNTEIYKSWFRSGHPQNGDVLVSTVGQIGKVSIMDETVACIAQNLVALRVKEKLLVPDFLYYYLIRDSVQDFLQAMNIGSAQPSIKVPHLLDLTVDIPTVETQKKIVWILKSLDDKIELNLKMNETLEEMAMTLYKHWFVDFGPFQDEEFVESELGMIPKGWKVIQVKDLGEVITGKTPSTKVKGYYGDKIPFIKIPDMHGNVYIVKTETMLSELGAQSQKNKMLPPNTVCVSCIATPGLVVLTSEMSQTNQQINSVVCKEGVSPYFVYLFFKSISDNIVTLGSGGTATLNLNKGDFSRIKLLMPTNEVMTGFNNKVESIFNLIKINSLNNIELENLRDYLLPRLLSGEIDVSKAEKQVEEVL